MDVKIEVHGEVTCDLGEGPLWCSATSRLYWHDVTNRRLHRSDATGHRHETWDLTRMPGCFGFRRAGGLIAAYRNRLALLTPETGETSDVTGHQIDFGAERFNDGRCDARGRLWAGTFDPSMQTASGRLYRVDPDLSVHQMDEGIAMANGMAWNPQGTLLYFADSRPGRIYRYAFDMERGTIGPREVFLDYTDRPGRPDGCIVDSEGSLWVAEVTAGRISRYAANASLLTSIELPVSKPTSVAFGGERLDTVFVSSMRFGLSTEELKREPLAGRMFRIKVPVTGMAEHAFGG